MRKVCFSSERLILVSPDICILQKKLLEDEFSERILISKNKVNIYFPKDWGEESKVVFPIEIERYQDDSNILPFWLYLIIDKTTNIVIGDIGCKTKPDINGQVEIGYGINPNQQRKGYATEAVSSLISYLLTHTDVKSIKAETNINNISSIKVLKKNGFLKISTRFDEEDGDLIIWEKRK